MFLFLEMVNESRDHKVYRSIAAPHEMKQDTWQIFQR